MPGFARRIDELGEPPDWSQEPQGGDHATTFVSIESDGLIVILGAG
jgi:hypothetical protein